MGCTHSFKLCFSPDLYPGVGLLGHMVVLFLVFKGISILFSVVVIMLMLLGTLSFSIKEKEILQDQNEVKKLVKPESGLKVTV